MILNIFISIAKYFFLGLTIFAMSVMLIAVSAMTYGEIVESLKTEQSQSQ